ncbi:MAG: transcriptional repressor [Leptospirales bacterium]|nr:transcriptional repressor [Leptospirales bacterium]
MKPADETVTLLKREGLRVTPQRTDILRQLAGKKGRVSVQQVFKQIQQKHPGISLDTVYRTLSTFANLGIVSQVNLQSGDLLYEYQGGAARHHHHAVCLSCGSTFCLDECPLPESYFQTLARKKFRVRSHAFEVYGYCSRCEQGVDDT